MNNKVIVSSRFEIKEILKKSYADMFQNLKVGDIITIDINIKQRENNGGGLKTVATISNDKNNRIAYKSVFELANILERFILEKIGEC